MVKNAHLSAQELRQEGLRALHDRLGVAGAIRFLREFNQGYGDYTAEREAWIGGLTVERIMQEIKEASRKGELVTG